MKKVNCKWTWKVICEKTSKQILQKSGETLVPQGGRNDVEFSFTPPKEGKWRIEASFVFEGDEEQKDSFVVQVLQKQKFIASRRGIALYDPKGLTKKELDRLGISYSLLQKLTSDCKEGTIAIGRECMTRELWDNVIIPAAVKGKDVVCFEQAKGDLEDIGFRVQERGLRKAWMRYNDPRLSNVISDDCLHDWAGESTLVDPDWAIKSDVPKDRLHRPTQMWAGYEMTRIVRANNRGCIATIIPEKPQVGDWRALADGLFALEYSPLLQMRTGGGSITMCQLDVTARTIPDVAADNIITKLLTIRHGPDGGKRPEFLGRDAEMMGYSWGIKSWGNCDDLLVSTGAKVPEDLEKRVANGATILCLGMTADEVKAWSCGEKVDVKQNEKHYFSRIEKIPAELNGLSNADFFWHGAMEFAAFSDSGAEGNAAFRIVRHGKGRVIFWQLPPWKFNIDERPHLRSSRRASARMAARLFGNIGWATFTDGTGYNNRPQYKDAPEAKDDPYEWVNL